MLLETYDKALYLYDMKLMQLDYENEQRVYFKGVHSVIFDKEKGWSCDCEHSSIWGVNKRDKEKCNHILCCQMILKERGAVMASS